MSSRPVAAIVAGALLGCWTGNIPSGAMSVTPGTYTLELETASHERITCEGIAVAAGQLTTVRVVADAR